MRRVAIALLVYCTLAVVAVIVMIVLNTRELATGQAQVGALESELGAARQARNRADGDYYEQEARQRRERGGYTGEQAVQVSLEVHEALVRQIDAVEACKAVQERLDAAAATVAATRIRFLPQALLLLVHIVGWLALLPYVRPKL